MDLAVISLIFEAGSGGILAKDIVARLPQYSLEKHRVLRTVRRVNRNVEHAFGKRIVEKRGKKWAFTDFGVEIWGRLKKMSTAWKRRKMVGRWDNPEAIKVAKQVRMEKSIHDWIVEERALFQTFSEKKWPQFRHS